MLQKYIFLKQENINKFVTQQKNIKNTQIG